MPSTSGPHRPNPLEWPLTPENVDGLDATIEDIYQELRRLATAIAVVEAAVEDVSDAIAAATSYTAFTKDLGAARRSGTFDITGLSGLTVGKVVTIVQTAAAIASKGNARDEPQMDMIHLTGYVFDATTIRASWWAPNVVVGTYEFAFLVSG